MKFALSVKSVCQHVQCSTQCFEGLWSDVRTTLVSGVCSALPVHGYRAVSAALHDALSVAALRVVNDKYS